MEAHRLALAALILALATLSGCRFPAADRDADSAASAAEAASPLGSGPADSGDSGATHPGDPRADDTAAECAEEGEACTVDQDGQHDCCMGRHTCFPEGCYYVQP